MLTQIFFFLFLLVFLFFISHKIATALYLLVYLLTKNSKAGIGVLAFLFLPGTFVHEFSHLVMATILRVHTGHMTIWPTWEKTGEIHAGKLEIEQTDPFRRIIIGLAPMISGLAIIFFINNYFLSDFSFSDLSTFPFTLSAVLGFYFLFVIANTMFSSKKDMESIIIVAPIVLIIALGIHIIGIRISLEQTLLENITQFFANFNSALLSVVIINFIVVVFLLLNLALWKKILHKKFV